MNFHSINSLALAALLCVFVRVSSSHAAEVLPRVAYNHPGLTVDLGVGLWAWPLPMDYDEDGDYDLVVVCPDVPSGGTYFFENIEGDVKMPVFQAAVRIDLGIRNAQVCQVDGRPRVLSPNVEYTNFRTRRLSEPKSLGLPENIHDNEVRANQWKYCDYDADGKLDLIVGVGDWTDYGWDNAYDAAGNWTNGPLHGYVYWFRNTGTNAKPIYDRWQQIAVEGAPIDVYGMPSPNFADFDGDGDLDIICGEFLDKFSYFENVGSRSEPRYASLRRLKFQGIPLQMDLQMITPTAIDWDKDGDPDLIVGDEDGRVALVENTGQVVAGTPAFKPPRYFQQHADKVKFGALVTPVSYDWDGDGDEDLLCGNSAGYLGYIQNLDDGNPPKWAAPVRLKADGKTVRLQAGKNGSIQGPCEAKWGYTTLSVADWNHDELPDLIVSGIRGRVTWYRNLGPRDRPRLAAATPVTVDWPDDEPEKPAWNWWQPQPGELVTQWRTTPVAIDFNQDGLTDLVMLDREGFLAFFERKQAGGQLTLLPPRRIFYGRGAHVFDSRHRIRKQGDGLLRLNDRTAGSSGRRKLCMTDWNRDGRVDLLVNSRNVNLLLNVAMEDDRIIFRDDGEMTDHRLAGHTTSPTVVDWNKDGVPELLIGAEDGFLYYGSFKFSNQ